MEGGNRTRKRKTSSLNRCYRYRKCAPFLRIWYENWSNYGPRGGLFPCHGHLKQNGSFKIVFLFYYFLQKIQY